MLNAERVFPRIGCDWNFMGAGRPTTYNADVVARAREYLKTCVDDFSDKDVKIVELPSVAGLARHLEHARDTMYAWGETNPEFSDILQDILSEQERRLLNQGLAGNYNSNIAKLALGKHGYHDTSAVDHTTKGEKIESSDPRALALLEKYEAEFKKSLT